MKNSICVFLAIAMSAFSLYAQSKHERKGKTEASVVPPFENTNSDVRTQINSVLTAYYEMKDALVADNEKATSTQAKAFRKTLEAVDMTKMTSAEHSFFMPLLTRLDYDAEHIQGSPNIDHMREHFVSFSENMFALVKTFKANNGTPVYYIHCPMYNKGANWISSEEKIKNPYFGKQMLTCGKVTETLK